jgi:hypothetical protein
VSAPWWHPEANPLADIQEFKHQAEQAWPTPPFEVILPGWWPADWPTGKTGG